MYRVFAAACLALGVSSLSASANPLFFQGSVTIESVNDGCANAVAAGSYATMFFLYSNNTSGVADAMSIYTPHSLFRFSSRDASGSLNGQYATSNTTDNLASRSSATSSVDLSESTLGGNPLGTAINVKVIGTVNDYFGIVGCDVQVHGLLVVRAYPYPASPF